MGRKVKALWFVFATASILLCSSSAVKMKQKTIKLYLNIFEHNPMKGTVQTKKG